MGGATLASSTKMGTRSQTLVVRQNVLIVTDDHENESVFLLLAIDVVE